ncbi:hypothetical protein AC1031_014013 [Aphanomyces cochlioides]|nr:hypothetical protein AC1031_014013 [Aphanomyces cochlioides]
MGKTPLHEAAYFGHLQVFNELVAHGADLDAKDNVTQGMKMCLTHGTEHEHSTSYGNVDGFTSLHWAASNGHTTIVKVLLDHGAPVDAANKNRDTPLHLAAENAKVEFVHENDPSVNSTNKTHKLGRAIAFANGQVEVLQLLLDARAKRLLRNKDGKTARDLANDNVRALFENYQEMANKQLLQRVSHLFKAMESHPTV